MVTQGNCMPGMLDRKKISLYRSEGTSRVKRPDGRPGPWMGGGHKVPLEAGDLMTIL
jgi:hypothetical protein